MTILSNKTVVITHDILFYRRSSFSKHKNFFNNIFININKHFEMMVLHYFYKVAVFAKYEKEILIKEGFHNNNIIQLGMPITAQKKYSNSKEYDFMFVGGNSFQNEAGIRCFVDRVIPIISDCYIKIAIVGGICESSIWDELKLPQTIQIIRLGHVNDLSETFSKGLIGIGTVPYGSGIKVKVVEMILSGLPMVLTNSGEEGIPVLRESVVNIDRESKDIVEITLKKWLKYKESTIHIGIKGACELEKHFRPSIALSDLGQLIKEKV
jgi:hypothetical protein